MEVSACEKSPLRSAAIRHQRGLRGCVAVSRPLITDEHARAVPNKMRDAERAAESQ